VDIPGSAALVWSVPVAAAAVAAGLVLAFARRLEDAAVELARAVSRLPELRRPLDDLDRAWAETDDRLVAFSRRHTLRPVADDGEDGDDGDDRDGGEAGDDGAEP
jgi:hypothetical protein